MANSMVVDTANRMPRWSVVAVKDVGQNSTLPVPVLTSKPKPIRESENQTWEEQAVLQKLAPSFLRLLVSSFAPGVNSSWTVAVLVVMVEAQLPQTPTLA